MASRRLAPSDADARYGLRIDEGEFVLADVRQSLIRLPADRPIRQLTNPDWRRPDSRYPVGI